MPMFRWENGVDALAMMAGGWSFCEGRRKDLGQVSDSVPHFNFSELFTNPRRGDPIEASRGGLLDRAQIQ
jgi:hypothetical protein